MSNEEPVVAKPRTWARKLGRGLLYTIAALFVLGFVAKMIWKYSGSNQWELVAQNKKHTVKIYALKAPGDELEQIKAVGRMHTSLAGIVKFMQDSDVCNDIGCTNSRVLERVDDQLQYNTFRFAYPFPFRAREFVVRSHFSQNPRTKEILLEYAAAPEMLPPSDCCYRITRMNNIWRFRPLGNGVVEAECLLNVDEGGFMPAILVNRVRRKVLLYAMPGIGKLMNKPKYQDAKFDWVKEP